MVLAADYPFLDIVGTIIVFFFWMMWFWTLIIVFGDLFSRHDVGGWGKAGWTLGLFLVPLFGVLIYLVVNGNSMAVRRNEAVAAQQKMIDQHIRKVASTETGSAAEIAHAKSLLDSGAITAEEFEQLKRKALA
ncbi:MAG: SHOCT domain-containing protein [Solirubrobacteraceae bacterium]|nr:SHOCT domain-containing protein [Solirubrobacteraceae bacterium]